MTYLLDGSDSRPADDGGEEDWVALLALTALTLAALVVLRRLGRPAR